MNSTRSRKRRFHGRFITLYRPDKGIKGHHPKPYEFRQLHLKYEHLFGY